MTQGTETPSAQVALLRARGWEGWLRGGPSLRSEGCFLASLLVAESKEVLMGVLLYIF